MTEAAIKRLRARYASMVRQAHALYAEGHGSRDVLRQCYGVEFPEEFFTTTRERPARPGLMANFTNVPWDLADPPDEGGPGGRLPRSGASLLAVLHQYHTEVLQHEEWMVRQPWNRGFGAVDQRSVDEARALLQRVEDLQR